jgi:hypothetical protein
MTSTIKKLDLFDANCMLGPLVAPKEGFPQTTAELLEVMDSFGIAEVLVYASESKEYHPAYGNSALLEAIAHVDRIHAMWVMMPSHTTEFPDEQQLVEEMLSRGVKAARIFPGPDRHNISLKEWCSGNLLRSLERKAIPLFIDLDQLDWDAVHELCNTYSKLPLVLTNVGYRSDRFLYPLWEKFNNLHIELSHYFGHRAIETLTDRFGAQRLLFGTGLPYYTPASAIGMLSYAKISESDKRQIAGDNLRHLLGRTGGS